MKKTAQTHEYRKLMAALRKAREDVGLTQGQVAQRIGAYASFVSKCESGERRLDILEFLSICKLYKMNPVELLRANGLLKDSGQ